MPKATKAQRALIDKLTYAKQDARQTVFRYATDHDTRFNECFKLAPLTVAVAYTAAADALFEAEYKLVMSGHAWRGADGTFYFNSN